MRAWLPDRIISREVSDLAAVFVSLVRATDHLDTRWKAHNTQLSGEDAEDQNVIHILTAGASSE